MGFFSGKVFLGRRQPVSSTLVFGDVRFLLDLNGKAASLHSADLSCAITADGRLVLSAWSGGWGKTAALPGYRGGGWRRGTHAYHYHPGGFVGARPGLVLFACWTLSQSQSTR